MPQAHIHGLSNAESPQPLRFVFERFLQVNLSLSQTRWTRIGNPQISPNMDSNIKYQTVPTIAAYHGMSPMGHGYLSSGKIAWKYHNLTVLLQPKGNRRRNYVKSWETMVEGTQCRRYDPESKWGMYSYQLISCNCCIWALFTQQILPCRYDVRLQRN